MDANLCTWTGTTLWEATNLSFPYFSWSREYWDEQTKLPNSMNYYVLNMFTEF